MENEPKKIPCDCPKGGMDSEGHTCKKCGGMEWVDAEPTHYLLCRYCGGKAFELLKKPQAGEVINAEDVVHADNPKPGDDILCQSCHHPLIDERDIIIPLIYPIEDWCDTCGGTGEITTEEAVYAGEPHTAPIGTRACPNCKRIPTEDEYDDQQ